MKILNILKKNKNNINGFTLIELMVATTIFSIIMLMGVGALIVSSNSAKAAQRLRIAMDNVNFAMESMTRELRVGTYYECASVVNMSSNSVADCPSGNSLIAFKPQQIGPTPPTRIGYFKRARTVGSGSELVRCINNSTNCISVVADNVDVQLLKFTVLGSLQGDTIQPSVKIIMKGVVTIGGVSKPFLLQSMSSQRSTEQ